MLCLQVMKTLASILASVVLAPSLLWADPAPRGPDFTSPASTQIDRSLAASDGTAMIEPTDAITFGVDSTTLDTASVSQLDTVATWMKAHPNQNVVLEGHTDRVGTHAYNRDLAKRRAERVRDHLLSWGLGEDRIVLAVYGERGAHRGVDESDRRVVVYASDRKPADLAASVLASTRADEVVWGQHGTTLEEQPTR
jgi:outer membrane protein OmpA-like peptidoglycan-associated protein